MPIIKRYSINQTILMDNLDKNYCLRTYKTSYKQIMQISKFERHYQLTKNTDFFVEVKNLCESMFNLYLEIYGLERFSENELQKYLFYELGTLGFENSQLAVLTMMKMINIDSKISFDWTNTKFYFN